MTKEPIRRQRLVNWKLFILSMLLALIAISVVTLPIAGVVLAVNLIDIPKLDDKKIDKMPQRSKIYADDGSILANFYFENRENAPLAQTPKHFQDAVIAIEDHRFYQHSGVDVRSVSRAFANNVQSGQVVEGGSTITQQYVKNAFLSNQRSVVRKIREAALAFQMEQKYSKKRIFELYLNTVYFGNGAYGTKSAAEVFFGKPLEQLNLAESALLAGLTKSPDEYSPYQNPKDAKRRRKQVLDNMLEYRNISRAEYDQAVNAEFNLRPAQDIGYKNAPHFVEYVRKQMIAKFGARRFLRGGLNIHTSLDLKMQTFADDSVKTTLNRPGDPSASLVSIDPRTGYIRAMVGGRDFRADEFNLAVQGRRQAGSAFKTFVLVAALEKGISPDAAYSGSSPIVIRMPKPGPDWSVKNYGNSSYGSIPLREATVKSVNVVYAQVVMQVGAGYVADVAKKMGVESPIEHFPAIALGGLTHGVSPLDMASAYATLAYGGKHAKATGISKVVNFQGKVLYEHKVKARQVLDPNVAFKTNDILKDVVARGTARAANIGRPQAGKTGTSQSLSDAWFVGYTPDLATAVWVGYPKKRIPMDSVHGISVVGGSFPAEIWKKFMSRALVNTPASNFPGPGGEAGKVSPAPAVPDSSSKNDKKQDTNERSAPAPDTQPSGPAPAAPEQPAVPAPAPAPVPPPAPAPEPTPGPAPAPEPDPPPTPPPST